MECSTKKTTIEVERLIDTSQLQTQLSAETAVPGAGREVIDVLMEQADITLGSIQPDIDGITVEGEIYCQAVYTQGQTGPAKAVAAQTRFCETIEMEGATPQSIVRAQGVVEYVSATYENGRMRFDMSITLRAQAHDLTAMDVITEIEGVSAIETRYEQIISSKLAAESSSVTPVSEEVALPSQLDARVALMDWSSARVISATPDLGGVKVTGEVCSQTLIGTGVSSRPLAVVKVVMPFEKLVEIPEWLSSDVTAEAAPRKVDARIQPGEQEDAAVLRIEGEAVVDIRADHEDACMALRDAYGINGVKLDVRRENIVFAVGKKNINCQEQFRGTLMLNEDAPGVGTVLAIRAYPVISQWQSGEGTTIVEGALDIKTLYLPSGSEQVVSARGELPFSMKCEGEWPQDAWVSVTATGCEAAALMSDRLEIRLTLTVTGFYNLTNAQSLATDVEANEDKGNNGGIIICWPGKSDDAWSVAKRYALALDRVPENIKAGVPVVLEAR